MTAVQKQTCLVVEADSSGEVLRLNDAVLRLLEEFQIEKAQAGRILPADFKVCVARCLSAGAEPQSSRSVVGDRTLTWVLVPDHANGHVGAYGFVLDRLAPTAAARSRQWDFQDIVESSRGFFYVHDRSGRFSYLSPNALELIGRDVDVENLRWTELLSDNPVNLRGAQLTQRALETGEKQPPYELELQLHDGRRLWVEISEAPQVCDGEVVGMVGSAHDVTDRVNAATTLRESEERYRALIERSPVVIFIVRDGRIVYVNPQGADLLDTTIGEIVGREAWAFAHPDDQEAMRDRNLRRMAGEPVPERYEVRFIARNGKTRWLDISVVPVEYGGKLSTISHGIDITERKQAEQALREAEARYRELYENATDIIYTHDLAFRLLSVNTSGEKILGHKADDVLGMDLRDIIHPDSRVVAERSAEEMILHPDRPSAPYEVQVFAADGKTHWLEVTSRLIMGPNGPTAVTGIAREITKRKRLEAQLRQAQKMEALGQLAGGVAHDFNNLLTGIMGYTRLLEEKNKSDPKAMDELKQIQGAAERAAALTRQLLAFSRYQPLTSVCLDLNWAVRDLVYLLSRTVGEHIEIKTDLAPDLEAIHADPAQIEQVLLNLTVNARDAMPDGGDIVIHTHRVDLDAPFVATHPWAKLGRYVKLTVADQGIGMQPHIRERVFEPFFTTKPPEKGSGLGLSIVYGIVKQHDGLIDLESTPGQGTAFHLYFPAAERLADAGRSEPPRPVRGGEETILLAEDEPIVRELATEVLNTAGYTVVAVEDGEQALARLRDDAGRFDLVILDMIMPRIGGMEVWKTVRAHKPDLRILLTSGYATESVSLREGPWSEPGFLAKPFAPDALLAKVREVLEADSTSTTRGES